MILFAGVLACTSGQPSVEAVGSVSAALTLPGSSDCWRGVGPGHCVFVPPAPPSRVFVTDGVMGAGEYFGAVELPYYDQHYERRAKVYVALETVAEPGGGNVGVLHVYAEGIPRVPSSDQRLALFVDQDRFEDHPDLVGVGESPDLALVYDFETNSASVFRAFPEGWANLAVAPAGASAVLGACAVTGGEEVLCNVELQLRLTDALVEPAPGETPGVGLALLVQREQPIDDGSMPEEFTEGPTRASPDFPVCDHPYCSQPVCRAAACAANLECCSGWSPTCTSLAAGLHVCEAQTCESTSSALCYNRACYDSRCAADPYCCNTQWDSICEDDATTTDSTCMATDTCATFTGFCEELGCRNSVCQHDVFCCTNWDTLCEEGAMQNAACQTFNPDLYGYTRARSQYQTVLFSEPPGTDFRIASYNGHRFGIDALDAPFDTVELTDVAGFLAPYDIVGLQEFWSEADVKALADEINDASDPGRRPIEVYGPVQHSNRFLESAVEWFTETNGGVWILSRYPVVDQATMVFHDCKGEDCLKAKGAIHARINLAPHTEAHRLCEENDGDVDFVCPAPATTEEYVDVFITHLQAGGSLACTAPPGGYTFANGVLSIASPATGGLISIVQPVTAVAGPVLDLIQAGLHCSRDSDQVRLDQLDQLGAFIAQRANPRRQALVLGDFNIDGQFLNDDGSGGVGGYADLLARLGAIPSGRDLMSAATDDSLPAVGADYSWGLAHVDLAREVHASWGLNDGLGTAIPPSWQIPDPLTVGADLDPTNSLLGDRNSDGLPDGAARLDYILAVTGSAYESEGPDYALARSDEGPTFAIRWPMANGETPGHPTCGCADESMEPGCPPDLTACARGRITDHMLVEAYLRLLPLRHPPRYHPDVQHKIVVEVTSVDASGGQDCFWGACNPYDLFSEVDLRHVLPGGTEAAAAGTPLTTGECEGWTHTEDDATCTGDWFVSAVRDEVTNPTGFRSALALFDADNTSSNDELFTVEGDRQPEIHFDYADGVVRLRAAGDASYVPELWTASYPTLGVPYTENFSFCTRAEQPLLCLRVTVEEVAP